MGISKPRTYALRAASVPSNKCSPRVARALDSPAVHDRPVVGCSLGCSHSQPGKPLNRLARGCCTLRRPHLRTSFCDVSAGAGARGGPEKSIKMATDQLRLTVRHEALKQAVGYSVRSAGYSVRSADSGASLPRRWRLLSPDRERCRRRADFPADAGVAPCHDSNSAPPASGGQGTAATSDLVTDQLDSRCAQLCARLWRRARSAARASGANDERGGPTRRVMRWSR